MKNLKTTKTTKTVAAKSVKKSAAPKTERVSTLQYGFVKSMKDEPKDETILGCVYAGIKKIKTGSLVDAAAAAVKAGFAKVSDQDVTEKTRIMLRRLANDGIVKITRGGVAEKTTSKKTTKTETPKKTVKVRLMGKK